MAWVRHHDRYDESYQVDAKQTYVQPAKAAGGCCAKEGQS
jgi:S-methylmethionine-dependent homocysteine/selenocysteine methylase